MKNKTQISPGTNHRGNTSFGMKAALIWLLWIVGVSILVNIYVSELRLLGNWPMGTDFQKFHLSSRQVLQGKNPYLPAHKLGNTEEPCEDFPGEMAKKLTQSHELGPASRVTHQSCIHPNLNPPAFLVVTRHLASLEFSTAWWLWSIASILSGILTLILIFRSNARTVISSPSTAALLGVMFFGYFPTFSNISLGQTTLFLFLPLALGWLALRNGENLSAGIWLGLAAGLKPFVLLLLPLLVLNANWRATASFSAVLFLSILIGGMVVGFDSYPAYASVLDSITWFAASWNASFAGFFTRLFGGSENLPWIEAPLLAKSLTAACSLAIFGVIAGMVHKLANHDRAFQADALFALSIPAMLLISPLGWMYYFPLLFISMLVVWTLTNPFPNRLSYRMILIFALSISAIPSALIPSEAMNAPLNWLRDAGPYFFALTIFFTIATITIQRTAESQLKFEKTLGRK